jgi:AraC-like DNA-binding protein
VPGVAFSTTEVAPDSQLAYWREMVNEAFIPLSVLPRRAETSEFFGSVSLHEVGELRVARVRAEEMLALHRRAHARASIADEYFLALQLYGTAHTTQDGRRATLRPGDFALFDSRRPYAIDFRSARGPFEHIIFRIPRGALDARLANAERTTATSIPFASREGSLAVPFLQTLARPRPAPSAADDHRHAAMALDMVAGALATSVLGATSTHLGYHGELIARCKREALAGLGNPGLSPASVAAASFVSVRQLHRLFAAEGTTFGAYVREMRLARCRSELADPKFLDRSIGAIAGRWGFTSPAHFTRAFKARYGASPRAFRPQR